MWLGTWGVSKADNAVDTPLRCMLPIKIYGDRIGWYTSVCIDPEGAVEVNYPEFSIVAVEWQYNSPKAQALRHLFRIFVVLCTMWSPNTRACRLAIWPMQVLPHLFTQTNWSDKIHGPWRLQRYHFWVSWLFRLRANGHSGKHLKSVLKTRL